MPEVTCLDGSRLGLQPVPVCDRARATYEITLRLTRNGLPFSAVGERCGYVLSRLVDAVCAARDRDPGQAAAWPDPDDRFPASREDAALQAWAAHRDAADELATLRRYVPGDGELFALRSRDPVDPHGEGELRCAVRSSHEWTGAGRVGWTVRRRAVLSAWDGAGHGLRAVLTSGELAALLGSVLALAATTAAYESPRFGARLARPAR